jgi:ribosomal protein L44E
LRFFNSDVPRYQKTPEHTDLSVTQYKRGAGPESEAKMKRVRRRCNQKVGSFPVPGKGRDRVTC